ncbi:Nudix hydrolase 8 [Hibiscus syriacus]|uniref:Nudix hydrolase 8 n=1 Tax=Hibiscus syriacus TaxID=106335 RepID=A0A6A3AZF1_HIBSY|nr:Nudix hydrolase 8 [Hibiscus syriacus]
MPPPFCITIISAKATVEKVKRLRVWVQNYDWEDFWMGTHDSGPSFMADNNGEGGNLGLKDWILKNPNVLGHKVLKKWGHYLPFLFKVLSVAKPLSIQEHPDKELAKELYKLKPNLYKDANHKPDMALAITEFRALCGFITLEANLPKEIVDYLNKMGARIPNIKLEKTTIEYLSKVGDGKKEYTDDDIDDIRKEWVLVIREKYSAPPMKIPTCFIDESAEIHTGAIREVKEETGACAQVAFGKSDMFFICMLKPLSTRITVDDKEIQAAKWLPSIEFLEQALIKEDCMFKKVTEICIARLGKRYCGLSVHQLASRFDGKISTLYYNVVDSYDINCIGN